MNSHNNNADEKWLLKFFFAEQKEKKSYEQTELPVEATNCVKYIYSRGWHPEKKHTTHTKKKCIDSNSLQASQNINNMLQLCNITMKRKKKEERNIKRQELREEKKQASGLFRYKQAIPHSAQPKPQHSIIFTTHANCTSSLQLCNAINCFAHHPLSQYFNEE